MLRGPVAAIISRVGSRLIGIAFLVLLARRQSQDTFAAYNYLLVLAATVSVVTDAGVAMIAGREVARGDQPLDVAYRAASPTQFATSTLAGVGVFLLGVILPGPASSLPALAWLSISIVATGMFNLQAELLRASGHPWVEASVQVLAALTQAGLGILVVEEGWGLAALFAVFTVRQVGVSLLCQFWLPSPWSAKPLKGLSSAMLRKGLWLGASTTLLAVILRLPGIALGNLGTVHEISDYAISTRYLDVLTTVCATVGFGLLPAMSKRSRVPGGARSLVGKAMLLALTAGIVGALIALPIVPLLTPAMFGERYTGATVAGEIFVGALPIALVMYLSWYGLVAERRERRVLAATGVGFVVSLAGLALIVAERSATVAALVTVAPMLAIGAFTVASVRRHAPPVVEEAESRQAIAGFAWLAQHFGGSGATPPPS